MTDSQIDPATGSHSDDNARTGSVLLRINDGARLTRSLSRVVGEACALQADSVLFTLASEGISVAFLKARQTVKNASMKSLWFEPIYRWLRSREVDQWSPTEMKSPALTLNESAEEFHAACAIAKEICFFRVRRSKGIGKDASPTIKLSHFNRLARSLVIGRFGLSDKDLFEKLLSLETGVLVLASTDAESEAVNLCLLQALSNISWAGKLEDLLALKDDFYKLGSECPVIVSVESSDCIDALLKLRENNVDFARLALKYVLCQGVAKANCPDCAKETVADKHLLAALPDKLRPAPNSPYFVGRGCKNCGNTGFRGKVLVHNACAMDATLSKLLSERADQGKLYTYLHSVGLRSLLDDGLSKVAKGMLTLESLFSVAKHLPQVYQKGLGPTSKANADENGIGVSDDYFVSKELKPIERPLSGKTAFNPEGAKDQGDSPLFALGRDGKIRQRPLLLVVEDDPDQRSILEMVLKSANYDVLTAADGAEGLEAVKREVPDLLVTDLMMPTMDGAELVQRLRLDNRYKSIPILVLTVVSDSDKEYSLLDLGADDYCEKTIQRKLLLKRIEALLRRTK